MDRSQTFTDVYVGNYEESSSLTANFFSKLVTKQPLPVHNYHWWRVDRYNPKIGRDQLSGSDCSWLNVLLLDGQYICRFDTSVRAYGPTNNRLHQLVSNKLIMKIRNSPVNLGVALGEYRETAEFFVGAVKRIVSLSKSIKDLKRFRFEDALHDLGRAIAHGKAHTAAANAWLEWTYAVRPILSDVAGVTQALYSNQDHYLEVRRVRVSHKENLTTGVSWSDGNGFSFKTQLVGAAKCTGYVKYVVENPFLATLDQLGVLNPVSVAYELIPFSFVLDWFVPVGDLLTNVVPPRGIAFQQGYTYVKARGDTHASAVDPTVTGTLRGWGTEVWKDRRALTEFPQYRLLIPDLSLSKNRITSAVSLLTQALSGGR